MLDVDPQGSASEWAHSGLLRVRVESVPSGQANASRWLGRATELAARRRRPGDRPAAGDRADARLGDHDRRPVLVPITPSAVDVAPTESVLRMIRITRESRRDGQPKALLVPNKVDPAASTTRRPRRRSTACTSAGRRSSASTPTTSTPSRSASGPAATPRVPRRPRSCGRSRTPSRRCWASSQRPGQRGRPCRAQRRGYSCQPDAGSCRVCSLMVPPPGPHHPTPPSGVMVWDAVLNGVWSGLRNARAAPLTARPLGVLCGTASRAGSCSSGFPTPGAGRALLDPTRLTPSRAGGTWAGPGPVSGSARGWSGRTCRAPRAGRRRPSAGRGR